MSELGLDSLFFYWFVTFSDHIHVIPAKAEADVLQMFFDECGRLPHLNKSL